MSETTTEHTKPANHAYANTAAFERMIEQRNALYHGLLAARKYARNRKLVPTAPRVIDPSEKSFWYLGVKFGLAALPVTPPVAVPAEDAVPSGGQPAPETP